MLIEKFQNRYERRKVKRIICWVALFVFMGVVVVSRTFRIGFAIPKADDAAVSEVALEAAHQIALALDQARRHGYDSAEATRQAAPTARHMAEEVAIRYGMVINAKTDIKFGNRQFEPSSSRWHVAWGELPFDVVRVTTDLWRHSSNGNLERSTVSRTIRVIATAK